MEHPTCVPAGSTPTRQQRHANDFQDLPICMGGAHGNIVAPERQGIFRRISV